MKALRDEGAWFSTQVGLTSSPVMFFLCHTPLWGKQEPFFLSVKVNKLIITPNTVI